MSSIPLPLLNSFKSVERSFITDIATIGYSGEKILIVTKSDDVYGLGPLPYNETGVDISKPKLISELCGKNVERFVFGGDFVFILTINGELFSWGENGKSHLGHGHKDPINRPTLISSMAGKKIIDITCGLTFALALDNDQQVHYWGALDPTPAINAIGITCSNTAAFYLSSNGEVYKLGYLNSEASLQYWTKIENLSNIQKVVAGSFHVMALSNNGTLFVWGNNCKKQLSYDLSGDIRKTPTKISFIPEKIIDIAANSLSNISVALTESHKLYVWGSHFGGHFSQPYLTLFSSFEEVFSHLSDTSMSYNGIKFQPVRRRDDFSENKILKSIFDVQEDSDLIITVEGKNIYVHKAILKARCDYFQAMFSNQWKENEEKIVKIEGYTYDAYKSFLSYLYCGEIKLTSDNVFELIAIAGKYCDNVLLNLVEKNLKNSSIPGELGKVLKEIIKLSPENWQKVYQGMTKMVLSD